MPLKHTTINDESNISFSNRSPWKHEHTDIKFNWTSIKALLVLGRSGQYPISGISVANNKIPVHINRQINSENAVKRCITSLL